MYIVLLYFTNLLLSCYQSLDHWEMALEKFIIIIIIGIIIIIIVINMAGRDTQ